MGAIGPGGVCVLNDAVIEDYGIESDVLGVVRQRETHERDRRDLQFRGGRPSPPLRGRTILLVDDGVATGSTALAAVQCLRPQQVRRIVVATPVIARPAITPLRALGCEVVALTAPEHLGSVSRWYQDFTPITEAQVCQILGVTPPPATVSMSAE